MFNVCSIYMITEARCGMTSDVVGKDRSCMYGRDSLNSVFVVVSDDIVHNPHVSLGGYDWYPLRNGYHVGRSILNTSDVTAHMQYLKECDVLYPKCSSWSYRISSSSVVKVRWNYISLLGFAVLVLYLRFHTDLLSVLTLLTEAVLCMKVADCVLCWVGFPLSVLTESVDMILLGISVDYWMILSLARNGDSRVRGALSVMMSSFTSSSGFSVAAIMSSHSMVRPFFLKCAIGNKLIFVSRCANSCSDFLAIPRTMRKRGASNDIHSLAPVLSTLVLSCVGIFFLTYAHEPVIRFTITDMSSESVSQNVFHSHLSGLTLPQTLRMNATLVNYARSGSLIQMIGLHRSPQSTVEFGSNMLTEWTWFRKMEIDNDFVNALETLKRSLGEGSCVDCLLCDGALLFSEMKHCFKVSTLSLLVCVLLLSLPTKRFCKAITLMTGFLSSISFCVIAMEALYTNLRFSHIIVLTVMVAIGIDYFIHYIFHTCSGSLLDRASVSSVLHCYMTTFISACIMAVSSDEIMSNIGTSLCVMITIMIGFSTASYVLHVLLASEISCRLLREYV